MLKNLYINLVILIPLLTLSGCAWENLPEGGFIPDFRLRITMRVQGQIDRNLFYFIVINYSGDSTQLPKPEFEGDERGMYWDVYYMYGDPRLTGHDFYRGIGGLTKNGNPKLDLRPIPSTDIMEFVPTSHPTPGVAPSGNSIVLELDFGKVDRTTLKPFNLNMMVSSLPFDRIDNPDDQFDAIVYDNFENDGVKLNLSGNKIDFNEQEYKKEENENVGENPPPNADIVSWRVLIL